LRMVHVLVKRAPASMGVPSVMVTSFTKRAIIFAGALYAGGAPSAGGAGGALEGEFGELSEHLIAASISSDSVCICWAC